MMSLINHLRDDNGIRVVSRGAATDEVGIWWRCECVIVQRGLGGCVGIERGGGSREVGERTRDGLPLIAGEFLAVETEGGWVDEVGEHLHRLEAVLGVEREWVACIDMYSDSKRYRYMYIYNV